MKRNKSSDDKIKHLPITENEKIILKKRILKTIQTKRDISKGVRFLIGIAASFGILLIAFYYFDSQLETPSITEYVSNTGQLSQGNGDEITLILGQGEKYEISEEDEEIKYSNSGKDIKIGASKGLNQEIVQNQRAVFNTLVVPYGKRMKTVLSDGSQVWLNSGSKLVYPAAFTGEKREVYVDGEAIFEVAHSADKPFHVLSDNQVIKVLGTVFSISNYKDDESISTILKSGSVRINFSDKSGSSTLSDINLSPGTKATFNKQDQSVVSEKVDVDTYFSWRKGFIIFNKNNLSYIMRRLSRYYNVEVKINNETILDETFSGYLNLNENVEKVLQVIQVSTEFDYKLEKNVIIIN